MFHNGHKDKAAVLKDMIEFCITKSIPEFKWGDFSCTIPPMPDPDWFQKIKRDLEKLPMLEDQVRQLLLAKEFKR